MKKYIFIFSICAIFSFMPYTAAQAYPGIGIDVVKVEDNSAVYVIDQGKRYVFPDLKTYQSWFGNDFSHVKTISVEQLSQYSLGGLVTHPAGKLVKVPSDPKVYSVYGFSGELHWIESVFELEAGWGYDWQSKLIDIPEAFFTSYRVYTDQEIQELGYNFGQPSETYKEKNLEHNKIVSDLKQVQIGMELYHNDFNGYPITDRPLVLGQEVNCLDNSVDGFYSEGVCVGIRQSNSGYYMGKLPTHPDPAHQYQYMGCSSEYYVIKSFFPVPYGDSPAGTYYVSPRAGLYDLSPDQTCVAAF